MVGPAVASLTAGYPGTASLMDRPYPDGDVPRPPQELLVESRECLSVI
jgi:hypothetical protein